MKYVRTENGIYEATECLENGSCYCNNCGKIKYITFFEIIKQADTLEELCDEFVVVNNTCFNTPQLLGTVIDKDYYKHEKVYGAIWTNKGLIYVAKMNDKGELELI